LTWLARRPKGLSECLCVKLALSCTSRRNCWTSGGRGLTHGRHRHGGAGRTRRVRLKTQGHFPNDDAATKLLRLALRNVMSKSIRSTRGWKIAMNQFAILYGEPA